MSKKSSWIGSLAYPFQNMAKIETFCDLLCDKTIKQYSEKLLLIKVKG